MQPEIESILQALTEQLQDASPELKEILVELRAGTCDEVTALARMMALMQDDPALSGVVEKLAFDAFAPLRDDGPAEPTALAEIDLGPVDPGDIIFDQGTGLPRLNPLYEARLAERLQFDGDIPELRTGALPDGGTPAVPVETTATNPVAVGMMLGKASDEVAGEIKHLTAHHAEVIEDMMGDSTGTELTTTMKGVPVLAPDPTGYQKGQTPALRKVEAPTGADLALLSPEQKQMAAWKAVSTTQGRRSMKTALVSMLKNGLDNAGYDVDVHYGPPKVVDEVPVYAEWTVDISGTSSTQPSFAFVDVAAKSLLRRLEEQLEESPVADPVMEVITIDTVDVRKVGWAVRIISRA